MYGAFLGDMIGAPYEFGRSCPGIEFPLFQNESHITDDSVMTAAVAETLMSNTDKEHLTQELIVSMRTWGRRYPDAGYGIRFAGWIEYDEKGPYNSCGNGSAMRVSAAGWLYDTIEETREIARMTAEVSHNHPEGIKGAESVASAIWLARNGYSKEDIRQYITMEFDYDLDRTVDEIKPKYRFYETCQDSVPESIICFLEAESFEEAVRKAVFLDGDTDTMACIAGSIAEAYFGIPESIIEEGRKKMPEDILAVADSLHCAAKKGSPDVPVKQLGTYQWDAGRPVPIQPAETEKKSFCEMIKHAIWKIVH